MVAGTYRALPTEKEWEKAARGRSGGVYPWGDEFVATKLNSSQDYSEDSNDESAGTYDGYVFWSPVDAIDADVSPYSVKGTAGNVSEWTADCWHQNYVKAPTNGSAWYNPGCKRRVVRGGYWASAPEQTRAAFRLPVSAESHGPVIGFRIARDL